MKVFIFLVLIFCILVATMCAAKFGSFVFDDLDFCLDTGICAEGLAINADGRTITVNKQSCIENNGRWNETRKECNFRE